MREWPNTFSYLISLNWQLTGIGQHEAVLNRGLHSASGKFLLVYLKCQPLQVCTALPLTCSGYEQVHEPKRCCVQEDQ